jgi:hypothetical protein
MLTFSVNKDINEVIRTGGLNFDMPTTDLGRAWLSEVVIKTLDEKTDDKVNVDAYAYACERNTKMAVGSKEVSLLTVEDIQMGARGVADTVANYIDFNIDSIVESSEVRTLVMEFLEVHENLVIDEGVNLWKVLKLAREANVKMIDKLRDIISRHNIEELIEGILTNTECLGKLEAEFA